MMGVLHCKGAGLFQRAGQTMNQACERGTSRYLIGIKNWPELISNWILMRIIFFGHLISHLWRKMAIVWAIFGMIFRLFTVSDAFMLKKGAHSTWIYLTHVRSRIQAILGPLSHKSMAGRRQKWSILDQKWPNMAGLSTFQSGPKGSKMVNLSVFDHLGPFWAHLDPFGPFQTTMNFLPQMGVAEVLRKGFKTPSYGKCPLGGYPPHPGGLTNKIFL